MSDQQAIRFRGDCRELFQSTEKVANQIDGGKTVV